MKIFLKTSVLLLLLLSLVSVSHSCRKDKKTLPVLSTKNASEIKQTSAVSGGEVTDNGGASILSRGICWNTSSNPTVNNNRTIEEGELGSFSSNLSSLLPNTEYSVRAYATNEIGTGYGNQINFTTKPIVGTSVSTTSVSAITSTSAVSGGTIISDGGGSVTARGVCWSITSGPTINDNSTTDGNGTGSFTSNLSGLKGGTTYYVRAYATNEVGIGYGNQINFTTNPIVGPSVSTTSVSAITSISAVSGGTITSDGGGSVTARGVCWSITPGPTINDNITSDGTGTGSFTSNLSGLIAGTKYYVRAYASNNSGTSYGDEKSFTTSSNLASGQIIADHTVVDRFDDIPPYYINEVKKMWFVIAGESHSTGYLYGLNLLEESYPAYAVNTTTTGTPEGFTASYLRASRATWGDYDNETGWIYYYGEEDWYTSAAAIARTKAGITYCNTHNLEIAAIGFGWCYDPDIEFGEGISAYLNATQQYIDYCAANSYTTKVFFTTGPVDDIYTGLFGYNNYLRYEQIRDYVEAHPAVILFDYADILCYDNGSDTPNTTTYDIYTYPTITINNSRPNISSFHTSEAGTLRIAKAIWWMLARIAGWDGN